MLGALRQKMADRQLLLADIGARKTLANGKPRLGYIGALGDANLGDEAMFAAAKLLYPNHELVTLLSVTLPVRIRPAESTGPLVLAPVDKLSAWAPLLPEMAPWQGGGAITAEWPTEPTPAPVVV